MSASKGADDPRIEKIKEILARDPSFSRHQIYLSLGVATRTLNSWIEKGYLPDIPKIPLAQRSPWKRSSIK